MPDKDINIHIRGQDTEQTKRQVDEVGKSIEQLGQKTAESTGQAAEKMSLWTSMLSKAGNYLLGIFGAAALIRETTAAIREQNEAMKEHADIALEQQNKLLRLQFLGDYYKEKPQLRKEVMAYAEAGRRPFEDVANAMYDLRNLGAGFTAKQQKEILDKSIELGRTIPQTPLNKIVQAMVFYSQQTEDKDFGRVQNILKQVFAEAGGEPAETAAQLSKFLPMGRAGGLTNEQATGVWAFATSQFPESGRATAGLGEIILALQGKGDSDSKRLLRRLGISPKATFLQQLQQLSEKQLNLKQIETITGARGAPILAALLQNPEMMMKAIGGITAAGESREDLTAKSIEGLYGQDEMARLEDLSRFLDIKIKDIKAMGTKDVRRAVGKKLQDLVYRKQTDSELTIRLLKIMDWFPDIIMGMHRWENLPESEIQRLQKTELPTEPNRPITINNNYDSSYHLHPVVDENEPNRMTFSE